MHKKIILYISFILIISACSAKEQDTELTQALQLYESYIGRTIVLPDTEKLLALGDHIPEASAMFVNAEEDKRYTITTLINGDGNSSGCITCVMDLQRWLPVLEEVQKYPEIDINFYLYTSDLELFLNALYPSITIPHPILADTANLYIEYNDLSLSNTNHYLTFLLNSNNEIIALGDPSDNENILNMYLETIAKLEQ